MQNLSSKSIFFTELKNNRLVKNGGQKRKVRYRTFSAFLIMNTYLFTAYILEHSLNNECSIVCKILYEFRILNRELECYLTSSCNGIGPAPFSMLNLDLLGKIFDSQIIGKFANFLIVQLGYNRTSARDLQLISTVDLFITRPTDSL